MHIRAASILETPPSDTHLHVSFPNIFIFLQIFKQLAEHIELCILKYANEPANSEVKLEEQNTSNQQTEVHGDNNLTAPATPTTPERKIRLERLLHTPPLGSPARVPNMRCFTSPRKHKVYDRIYVEMQGQPRRISATPSHQAFPLARQSTFSAQVMQLAPNSPTKTWRYTPATGFNQRLYSPKNQPHAKIPSESPFREGECGAP